MLDKHLETFITAADCGSFLKAADKLYVSANAVTKQINLLEDRLNVKLFTRSSQGITLTAAGDLIYRESKRLMTEANAVLEQAQKLSNTASHTIYVGTSMMNPMDAIMPYWPAIKQQLPNEALEMVPFDDDLTAFAQTLASLENQIDIVFTIGYQDSVWKDLYQFKLLSKLPIRLAVSKQSPLAFQQRIDLSALTDYELLFAQRGLITDIDHLQDRLMAAHPKLTIRNLNSEGYKAFNEIASNPRLCLITTDNWAKVHPLVTTIAVNWEETIRYGIAYSRHPSDKVREFLAALDTAMAQQTALAPTQDES